MLRLFTFSLITLALLLVNPAGAQVAVSPLSSPLAEVRYSSVALTEPRITSHYKAGKPAPFNPWAFIYLQSWGQLWH